VRARIKFQVLGPHGWCTAYVLRERLDHNRNLFRRYGYQVRVRPPVGNPSCPSFHADPGSHADNGHQHGPWCTA
jgi:hypothetical protein